jgi:hypothetical protein
MPLDIGWVLSVSLAGIVAVTAILAIINILVGRAGQKNNHAKTNGLVR